MASFDSKIPDYLTTPRALIRQVLFTAFFALVFINMYSPFGVEKWYTTNQMELLLYSSMVILTGMLIIVISRLLMFWFSKKRDLSYLQYGLWIAGEILALALIYALLEEMILHDERDFLTLTKLILKYTALVVLLPYAIYWLYLSWQEKKERLDALDRTEEKGEEPGMIPVFDEKNVLRLSIKRSDFLYVEAADNYVMLYYRSGIKTSRELIRNSLKNMEEQLKPYRILRCHRSYMVNMDQVKLIRREKDGFFLELDVAEETKLPVSKTYYSQIISLFTPM
jgi:hypothetical protein